MERAAFLPAPIASITVAAPDTITPPVHTLSIDVFKESSSTSIVSHFDTLRSGVVCGIIGLGLFPIAIIQTSIFILNSEPSILTGLRLPDASGSPSSILKHSHTLLHVPEARPLICDITCISQLMLHSGQTDEE